jgi:FMN-dependent NADH-azoreductase
MALTVLTIASSPMGERSVTRRLANKVLEGIKAAHPESTFLSRDLAAVPLPHIDGLFVASIFTSRRAQ